MRLVVRDGAVQILDFPGFAAVCDELLFCRFSVRSSCSISGLLNSFRPLYITVEPQRASNSADTVSCVKLAGTTCVMESVSTAGTTTSASTRMMSLPSNRDTSLSRCSLIEYLLVSGSTSSSGGSVCCAFSTMRSVSFSTMIGASGVTWQAAKESAVPIRSNMDNAFFIEFPLNILY